VTGQRCNHLNYIKKLIKMELREKIYKTEEKISQIIGDNYCPTMNHRYKGTDSFKTITPTVGLYKKENIFLTTNNASKFTMDESIVIKDRTHFMKKDEFKTYYEELSKDNKIRFESSKKEAKSNSK